MGKLLLARALTRCLVAAAFLTSPLLAQSNAPVPNAETREREHGQTQDLIIGERDSRMTVPVFIGGQGPFPFVIDTGAERTVLSRQLAERLQLTEAARIMVHGIANSEEVRTVRAPHVAIGSSAITINQAPLFEASDIGAAGLLGVDALTRQRVVIDFKARTMSVSPSSEPIERVSGDTIVVRAMPYHGRLMFKHAIVGSRRTMVMIDTGSQDTLGNPALLAALGRHVVIEPEPVMIETITGKAVSARLGKIDEITIDDVRLTNIYVAFADVSGFRVLGLGDRPALLLGMNVMRAFDRVSIDFAQRRVRFTFPHRESRNEARLAAASDPQNR